MKIRVVAGAIFLIVLVVIGLYWYQTLNGPLFHTTYSIGDEIKGFPVSEMSLTVCNMTTSQTILMEGITDLYGGVNAGSQVEFVILTVAIHNLEDYQIYFDRASDFGDRFSNAVGGYTFLLTYGAENHQVIPEYAFIDSNNQNIVWQMGILMPNAKQVTSLAPHQTVYGYLYYTVGQYYTPNQLLCVENYYTNSNAPSNPNFVVNLKS